MKQMTRYEALERAVQIAGSQQAFADLISVSQPTVSRILKQLRQLPAEHVLTVEQATGVSRHLLRPDIYPREIDRALSPSEIGEPFYECGPILSVRAQAGNANRGGVLANGGAA